MENKSETSTSSAPDEGAQKPPVKSLRQLMAEGRNKAMQYSAKPSHGVEVMDYYEAVNNYKKFQERKTGYIEQESTDHYCIWDKQYPESPERVMCIRRRLAELDLIRRCKRIISKTFPENIFLQKHSTDLFERLRKTSDLSVEQLREESSKFDSIFLTQDTFNSAKKATEAALTLTLEVAKNECKNGFAVIRPPGHHAMANEFCGYCFFNNAAICAETVIAEGLAKKILIVDYDVHHGQGTQQAFYHRNDVLYFSIHRYEHGEFWPNLRESDSDHIGSGQGKGYNVNVPLNKTGLGDSDYLAIVFNLLLPIAYEFNPDLIVVSSGYDSCVGDEKGEMRVSPQFYGHLMSLLSGLANGKLVCLLEGGYFKESLAEGVAWTLQGLLGDICYTINIESNPTVHPVVEEVINNVKYFLRNYWKCFQTEEFFEYPRLENMEIDSLEEHVTTLEYKHIPEKVDSYPTSNCYTVQTNTTINRFTMMIKKLREEYSKSRSCDFVVGYIYDDLMLNHKPTYETGKCPPERPERLIEIMKRLNEFRLRNRCKKVDYWSLDERAWIKKVHGAEYISNIFHQKNITEKVDWYFNDHTSEAILKCVSSVLSLVKNISYGTVKSGFAVVRPPGHHAMSNQGSGFCFVNNAVIAAEYMIQELNFKRVLIVDFDIHHGNGTQELTYERSDILYISIHRFDHNRFFPAFEKADYMYTGKNEGEGYNVNIPFNKDKKKNIDYWTVWYKLVLPIAYSYNPHFVIISAGFDAGIFDPLGGGYQITPEMFGLFVQTLKYLACGRILLVLEGGYHLETCALSMVACVKALLGDPLPVPNLSDPISEDTLETIKNVIRQHRAKWPLLQVNKKIANFSATKDQLAKLKEMTQAKPTESLTKQIQDLIIECKNSGSDS